MLPLHALFVPFLVVVGWFGPGWLGTYLAEDESGRIVVTEVIAGSPAQKAGVNNGDVVAAIDGKTTTSVDALVETIRGKQAGDKVKLTLARSGGDVVVEVVLGERPADNQSGARLAPPVRVEQGKVEGGDKAKAGAAAGLETKPLTKPEKPEAKPKDAAATGKPYLGLALEETDNGVMITDVLADGPAGKAKVATGRLQALAGNQIKNLAEMDKVMAGVKPGQQLTLTVQGRDYQLTVGAAAIKAPESAKVKEPTKPVEPSKNVAKPTDRAVAPAAAAEQARARAEAARAEVMAAADKARAEAKAAEAKARQVAEEVKAQAKPVDVAQPAKPAVGSAGDDPRAQLQAARGKRAMALVFGASWDASTKALRKTFDDQQVKAALGDRQVVWFDTDRFGAVADEFKVQQIPHIVLLDAAGKQVKSIEGFQPAEALVGMLGSSAKPRAAGQPVAVAELQSRPAAAAAPAAPVSSAERDLEKEIRELRNEIRELRQTLRELLNERRR